MRRKILTVCMALVFSLSMAGVGMAAKCSGKVVEVKDGKMVIELDGDCGIDSGKVEIKSGGKRIEGC